MCIKEGTKINSDGDLKETLSGSVFCLNMCTYLFLTPFGNGLDAGVDLHHTFQNNMTVSMDAPQHNKYTF